MQSACARSFSHTCHLDTPKNLAISPKETLNFITPESYYGQEQTLNFVNKIRFFTSDRRKIVFINPSSTDSMSALSIYSPFFDRTKENIVWEKDG